MHIHTRVRSRTFPLLPWELPERRGGGTDTLNPLTLLLRRQTPPSFSPLRPYLAGPLAHAASSPLTQPPRSQCGAAFSAASLQSTLVSCLTAAHSVEQVCGGSSKV